MAQISLDGFDEIDRMFKELGEIPFEVTAKALDAMAECYELVKNGTIVPASNFNGHTPTNFPGL